MSRPIKWKGKEYLLITLDELDVDGPMATEEQYSNFETSEAHLFPNGNIMQFGSVVGTIRDIEFLDVVNAKG